MIKKSLSLRVDRKGFTYVLELMIAIGLTIALLLIFFISANNFYKIYDRPDIDMHAKSIAISEILLSTPGENLVSNPIWENDPENTSILGLGTSPLIEYGVIHVDEQGNTETLSRYRFMQRGTPDSMQTCFLPGTEVLMSDGSYKKIENIEIGDVVKSLDEKTGNIVNKRVTAVF
ncbi:MAG: hypothetical protein DRN08_01550, partial [Thermoplasmata archaeon]